MPANPNARILKSALQYVWRFETMVHLGVAQCCAEGRKQSVQRRMTFQKDS